MSDRDESTHPDAPSAPGGPDTPDARQDDTTPPPEAAEGEAAPAANGEPIHAQPISGEEAAILHDELAKLRSQVEEATTARKESDARALRAFAELDTVRRRAAGDQDRAREAGLDAAVLPVMIVHDDLRRALVAAEGSDPASIVPGVRAVMETLERNLEKLDIRRVGEVGDTFDPDMHEALTSAPLVEGAEPGTIAEVFEAGFMRGDRLIRAARVVVYQDDA